MKIYNLGYRANIVTVILVMIIMSGSSSPRRMKMLVRRKIPINNNTNKTVTNEDKKKKIIKRKLLIPGNASVPDIGPPVLSSPLLTETSTTTPLPQHKPFTVNETVAAKPDAVKRCEYHVMRIIYKSFYFIFYSIVFSFVTFHNCVMETRTLCVKCWNQWNMLLLK